CWCPIQYFFGQSNVWLTLLWIIHRKGHKFNFGRGVGKFNYFFCKLEYGKLMRITHIYRADKIIRRHHFDHTVYQIIYILETARLRSISIDSNISTLESLYDKIRDNASVLRVHSWAICVEDSYDLNIDLMLTMIIHEKCFCTPFAFIITRANTDRVDITPIILFLWVYGRIAIYFTCGRL